MQMKTVIIVMLSLFSAADVSSQELKKQDRWLTMENMTTPEIRKDKSVQPIPLNLYAKSLGFFCRQELNMQKAHMPVTFRLGSMDYCNRLEQKPGYR